MDVGEGRLRESATNWICQARGIFAGPDIGLFPRGAAKEKILAARERKKTRLKQIAEDLAEVRGRLAP
jgi:hypothetical protein